MKENVLQTSFLALLLISVFIFTAFIFLPYFSVILVALVLAVIFHPVHKRIFYWLGERRILASLLSTFLVLLIIVIPLLVFGFLLFKEVTELYQNTVAGGGGISFLNDALTTVTDVTRNVAPSVSESLNSYVQALNPGEYASRLASWAFNNLNSFFSGFVHILVSVALAFLLLFYLFKDGEKGIVYVKSLSPLPGVYDQKILNKIKVAINSVIRGRILVGIIQGVLTGIALAVFGVPGAVILGFAGAVFSVIPLLGPGLIITPIALYLLFVGNIVAAAGLLAVGVVAIFFVDDLLGPIIIERGVKIHPFLILLSILGGIALLGPVGFIAGPVVLALLFALLEIYQELFQELGEGSKYM